MSFQWTFVAGCLYFEIIFLTVLILPIFSPRIWNNFFKSRLFDWIRAHISIYFYITLGILCLLLLDTIRDMRKYSATSSSHIHLGTEMKESVKLFRSQRNFYITGFAIFLSFVIRKMISLLIIQDELSIKAARIIKEAESTVDMAKKNFFNESTMKLEEKKLELDLKSALQDTEGLLEYEKQRRKELEEETSQWRQKYEEAIGKTIGKGDE